MCFVKALLGHLELLKCANLGIAVVLMQCCHHILELSWGRKDVREKGDTSLNHLGYICR